MTTEREENISIRRLTACPDDVRAIRELLIRQPDRIFSHWGACGRRIDLIEKHLSLGRSFAIILDDETIVGMIGYKYKPKSYVWGFDNNYWLDTLVDKRFNGRGIATVATRLLMEQLRREGEVKVLYSGVYSTNIASIRVKEKLGFKEVGRWKNIIVFSKDLLTVSDDESSASSSDDGASQDGGDC